MISVVIPAFNEASCIETTLESVFRAREGYPGPVEVIVVDNNSTDGTGRIAGEQGATVVFESKNQIARARNAGAEAASGDHLIFLDADTTVQGNIFHKVDHNLVRNDAIGGGAWVEPDAGWLTRKSFNLMVNRALALMNVTVGPFLYCDREAFEKVEGFDESFYAAEEFSLAKRLKHEGRLQSRQWRIIKHHKDHRIVTSNRKFSKFGVMEMAGRNMHLLWKPNQKIREKEHCRFWYEARKD